MRPILTTGLLLLALLHSFAQVPPGIRKVSEPATKLVEAPAIWTGFNELPDSGSVCSVTLLVQKAWDPLSGHAFLQLVKSDGQDSVVRFIGFYRANPKQALFSDVPVPAKLTDDGYHAYHASLRRQISPADLQAVLRELQRLSTVRYQTYHFNSVDFALRLMDELRLTDPVFLPRHPWTPGRLYRFLRKRKARVQDPREIILVSREVRYAGGSHTPAPSLTLVHHS
jgi:hypothetical protein